MEQNPGASNPVRSSRNIWKIFMWIGIGLVVLVFIAYLGISAFAASTLTQPQRNFNTALNPGAYNLEYQDITFPARGDGLKIAAWYIPSEENQKVIILVHGYNNSRTNGFLDKFVKFASELQQAGFSVMMIDLRGHGQSEAARFTFGVKESQDVLGAVDWLEKQGYQPGKIGVLGYSLGAGSIIRAAAQETDIGAVWADSLFADIKPVLDNGWTSLSGLPQVFLYSTEALVRLFYGYDISASRPIDDIGKIAPRPIMLAHCQEDKLIPLANLEQVSAVAQGTQTWIIPNCDIHTLGTSQPDLPEIFNNHAIGYTLNPAEYTQKVTEFFGANLK